MSRVFIDFALQEGARRGWTTHAQLADVTGIARNTITGQVNGQRGVNADHLLAFFNAFGMDLSRGFYELARFAADHALPAPPATHTLDAEGYKRREPEDGGRKNAAAPGATAKDEMSRES
jgi:transcriptional regulator with XRE-family HTH domain